MKIDEGVQLARISSEVLFDRLTPSTTSQALRPPSGKSISDGGGGWDPVPSILFSLSLSSFDSDGWLNSILVLVDERDRMGVAGTVEFSLGI